MINDFQREDQTSLLHEGLVDPHRLIKKSQPCLLHDFYLEKWKKVAVRLANVKLYMHMEK